MDQLIRLIFAAGNRTLAVGHRPKIRETPLGGACLIALGHRFVFLGVAMQVVTVSRPAALRPQADGTPDLRRELLNFAEPVIADRIIDGYRTFDASLDPGQRRFLAAQHRRLWRAILLDHQGLMGSLYIELHGELVAAGLGIEAMEAVDQSVFEELVEIVLRCFRFSHAKVKQCMMILLDAASFVGAARAA